MNAFGLAAALGACWVASVGCVPASTLDQDALAQAALTAYRDDARCRGQGLHEDTSAYRLCRKALARERDSAWILLAGH